jgi:hypothetical protein
VTGSAACTPPVACCTPSTSPRSNSYRSPAAVHCAGLTTVGLLGTAFTMEQDFYRKRLAANDLTVLVPDRAGRARVHQVIYDEL